MQMNFAFTWPGLYKDEKVGGNRIGFFPNPAEKYHFAQLGGQGISVVSYSSSAMRRFSTSNVRPSRTCRPSVAARRLFLLKAVVDAPGFKSSQPYATAFLESMANREGLLGRAELCRAPPGHAEAGA